MTRESAVLTVAAIRSRRGAEPQVLFHQRQRIFTLAPQQGARAELSALLRDALRRGRPVAVTASTKQGVIQRVTEPSEAELARFRELYVPLERPSRIVPIDVQKIDRTTFDIVDRYLKWPVFRLCRRIVPSYAKAKEIFDFCAALSCHLGGPYAVTPCIPFQYVIDGCYARAHQMRRIITTRYRYCCEKVFSFATENNDTLAVRADKWGGCCVFWWYHVAPLIRVRVRWRGYPRISFVLAMVIDPSMFDRPVTLSRWLSAQENTSCSGDGRVSSYSIQPGSAYTPGGTTGFSTDPSYTLTKQTLLAYSGLTTC